MPKDSTDQAVKQGNQSITVRPRTLCTKIVHDPLRSGDISSATLPLNDNAWLLARTVLLHGQANEKTQPEFATTPRIMGSMRPKNIGRGRGDEENPKANGWG